ncbi:hypothetical protein QE152_g27753 [Popillia japonica]|uniref:Uncharacterized protein n=1 Tax=Popillia japonica TaxID=7064 RepID=A0AAW1JLF7_POPJA
MLQWIKKQEVNKNPDAIDAVNSHHIRSRSTQSSNFKQSSVPSSSYTSKKGVAQSHSHKNVAVDKEAGSQQKSRCHRCGKQHNPET